MNNRRMLSLLLAAIGAILAASTQAFAFEVRGIRSGEPIIDVAARLSASPGINVQQQDGSLTFWRNDPMQWVEVSSCEGRVSSIQVNLTPGLWSTVDALDELIARHGQPNRVMTRGPSQLEQVRRAYVSYFWRTSGYLIQMDVQVFVTGGRETEQLSIIYTKPTSCWSGWPE